MKIRTSISLSAIFIAFITFSCGDSSEKPGVDSVANVKEELPQFEALTISVDESNINTLMILLVKDGTINRKGSVSDTSDHNFLMGMTEEKLTDAVNAGITADLLAYCSAAPTSCDTTTEHTKVELVFSARREQKEIKYCVQGGFDKLPAPIKSYILHAQTVTADWHSEQISKLVK